MIPFLVTMSVMRSTHPSFPSILLLLVVCMYAYAASSGHKDGTTDDPSSTLHVPQRFLAVTGVVVTSSNLKNLSSRPGLEHVLVGRDRARKQTERKEEAHDDTAA